ncbi:MAG: efflux RND transporter periplasmic adaptor subunit [Gammaproteobacteria bacterium]|nr:efflux RND transporter periplasmic adaptor subunit [Gammaproteobacteria bacterium]
MSKTGSAHPDSPPGNPGNNGRASSRRRGLILLALVVVAGVVAWSFYWFLSGRFHESTDDAYVSGDVIAITSREAASVLAVHADNTQSVQRGQLLVELDPARAQVAMQAAQADLARTVRGVRAQFARVDQFDAEIAAARVQLAQAQEDYRLRQASAGGGAVAAEEIHHARDAVTTAQASSRASASELQQARAAVAGTSVNDNPEVLAAIARVHDAAITLSHMQLVAPVDGVVAQRNVQIGQHVAPGTPLMAVVPLADVWVDANFKEGQLEDVRVGQPATITADIYGAKVSYHGRVQGLGAGTGAAFALLPPQDASGNWIKIVQRVPVRVALDAAQLREHPLRVGLSVSVMIDISDTTGPLMSEEPLAPDTRAETGDAKLQADRIVARILAQNNADAPVP